MRVVFDTNVLVSAFATEGLCARLLIRANRREFNLFVSPAILTELEKALAIKIGLTKREIQEAFSLLAEVSRDVDPARRNIRISGICADETDHAILEAAVACRADIIVTGDRALLELGRIRKTRIVTPREFELLFD